MTVKDLKIEALKIAEKIVNDTASSVRYSELIEADIAIALLRARADEAERCSGYEDFSNRAATLRAAANELEGE
jgi:hypothetical protein